MRTLKFYAVVNSVPPTRMRLLRLFFMALGCAFMLHATPLTAEEQNNKRKISELEWKRLTNHDAFDYSNDVEKAPKHHIQSHNQYNLLLDLLQRFFQFWSSKTGQTILWVILGAAVVYVIFKWVLNSENLLFYSTKKVKAEAAAAEGDEDITVTDWEALIRGLVEKQEMSAEDVRLAIRYCYMMVLQLLQKKALIAYRSDKTNYDYAAELAASPHRQLFRQLSRHYEYAWYGRYGLTTASYKEFHSLFDQLKTNLR
jgi:Domain of unknown function (DUF4129)